MGDLPLLTTVEMEGPTFTRISQLSHDTQTSYATDDTTIACAPILRLPPRLRHHIYLHTEILARYENGEHAVLNLNGGTPVPSGYGYFPDEIFGFHGLLLSCRTIYTEASALLYRHNRFIIRYWEHQSLAPLRNLTPSSISNLTYLKVVLNQASCHHKGPEVWHEDMMANCDDERVHNMGNRDESHRVMDAALCNAPLEIGQPEAEALYAEWHSTMKSLSPYINPGRLELSVVCDGRHDDIEAAMRAVEPMSLLPSLADCHIRLSRMFAPRLYQIAQETVLQARRISKPPALILASTPKQPDLKLKSHLLALPREIRFRILEYTDLITPWKEVTWSRYQNNGPKYKVLYLGCPDADGMSCSPEFHHGCRFFNCWEASKQQQHQPSAVGCFCRVRHSAASPTCVCWTPPSALFLVSDSHN